METVDLPKGAPDLFSKIGPLPAWAWASMVVGGYLVYTHINAGGPIVSDGTDNLDTGYGDENAGTDFGGGSEAALDYYGGGGGYNYGDVLSGDYDSGIAGSTFTSNQQWGLYAISALIAHGTGAATATSAISHYLAGTSLTNDEAAAINAAITLVGPPPLPLPLSTIGTGTSIPSTETGGTSTTPPVATTTQTPTPVPPIQQPTPVSTPNLPSYDPTGNLSHNPYYDFSRGQLMPSAAIMVVAKLAARGIKASTSPQSGIGWQRWSSNLYVYGPMKNGIDPLAKVRGPLSTIVSQYSSASSAQAAMGAL